MKAKPPIKLIQMCREGYWYCEKCERNVNLPLDLNSPATCPHCKKPLAVWQTPAFQHEHQNN